MEADNLGMSSRNEYKGGKVMDYLYIEFQGSHYIERAKERGIKLAKEQGLKIGEFESGRVKGDIYFIKAKVL